MIIPINTLKAFAKVYHTHIWLKKRNLSNVGIEGNLIKSLCKKPTANIINNGERLNAILRLGTNQERPLLFNIVRGVLNTAPGKKHK